MTQELTARQKQQIADLPREVRERVESMIHAGFFYRMKLNEIVNRAFMMLAYEHEKRAEETLAATAERRERENENADRQPTNKN